MDLTKILSISGKAGLFKVIGQTKNSGIIVESLIDGKRFPAYAAHKITSLEDISIYTETDDVPLKDIFKIIFDKEGDSVTVESSSNELREYFKEILPDFDEERVYNSDIKKVFKWYNDLTDADMMVFEDEKEEEIAAKEPEEVKEGSPKPKAKKKKPAAKKPAAKKADGKAKE